MSHPGARRNGKLYTLRKRIRDEARKRMFKDPRDLNARQVYDWVHAKIRRFYAVVPLDEVWFRRSRHG